MSDSVFGQIIPLDAGPLGKIAHRRRTAENDAKFRALVASAALVYLPETVDYEVRRSFILEDLTASLQRLDALKQSLLYLPLETIVMVKAAELWAQVREAGKPTAAPKELDGDVILAAQALSIGGIVVTDNPGHLSRFVTVKAWTEIQA